MRYLGAIGLAFTFMLAGCADMAPAPAKYTPKAKTESDALTRARLHMELASAYLELGNHAVALEEAAEALKADPAFAPALNVLGLIYMELRDDKAAEANFQQALRINPQDSDSNNNYGWFLCQRKREQESVKYFLAALRNPLYTTPDKSWVNAGICARQAGDLVNAEEYFQRALKLRPNHPQALYQMADLVYRRKNYSEAKTYMSRLQGNDVAGSPEWLWLALRIERALGDRTAEASLGFQLRKNFPNSREARALLAGQNE